VVRPSARHPAQPRGSRTDDWHWSWATGNGDLGNNGVHLLDVARRMVRADGPPRRILGLGGRYVHDDAAETPNTQLAVYDFPGAPVIFEQRGLPAKPGVNFMDQAGGLRVGLIAHCEGGTLAGLIGCTAKDPQGQSHQKLPRRRWRRRPYGPTSSTPSAAAAPPISPRPATGHASAAICHYGTFPSASAPAAPAAVATALASFRRGRCRGVLQTHLGVHGVDLAAQPMALGPWLEIDATGDTITAAGTPVALDRARQLLREPQRPQFAIPDAV